MGSSVERTKQPIVITRHGTAVAELRPVSPPAEDLIGSVTILDDGLTRPVLEPEDWEASR